MLKGATPKQPYMVPMGRVDDGQRNEDTRVPIAVACVPLSQLSADEMAKFRLL